MKKNFPHFWLVALASVLLFAYIASWIVMPRLGKSYELNFDHGCDAGVFGLLDLQSSTCASGGPTVVGFPLSIHPGPVVDNLLSALIDVAPAVVLLLLLTRLYRRS